MKFATGSSRVEGFSDGVIAVIITIMVLELHLPQGTTFGALVAILPSILLYALSFAIIGIYWNNHHHTLRASRGVDGRAMWLNLHLLFWLSLVPFSTAWFGRNPQAVAPAVIYSANLWICGIAYYLLQQSLVVLNGASSVFAQTLKGDRKGLLSVLLYTFAIIIAFFSPLAAEVLLAVVAIIWFVPDRRLEPLIAEQSHRETNS